MPPDRRGLIPEIDEQRLRALGEILRRTFETNLARGRPVTASNVRAGERFAPERVADGDRGTYWATDETVHGAEITIDLGSPTEINVVELREQLPLGQRVDSFEIQGFDGAAWRPLGTGTSIGSRRLVRTPTVAASRIRVRLTCEASCPAIAEIGLYRRPDQ
jgi:alpha-L-fucosidase